MERLEAFEKMLQEIQSRSTHEKEKMDELKAAGKEKSATYRQYLGNRLLFQQILALYAQYGLIDHGKEPLNTK